MTICIAALAENGKKVVVAADQMITANIPIPYQFETGNVPKIYDISDKNAQILTAGNAIYAYEIVNILIDKIKTDKEIESTEQITELARRIYQDVRRKHVIERFIQTRGLSLDSYLNNQKALHEGVVSEIEKGLQNYNIDVDLIVAGGNTDKCHIYNVSHPGIADCHDPVGYVCVGSGAPHAMYYLIGSKYNKQLGGEEVKKIVSNAKKRSEVAPGVGKETTIQIIEIKR
jgi:20S proteasome alpha/beta subunit